MITLWCLFVFLLYFRVAQPQLLRNTSQHLPANYRLSEFVIPLHYDLMIKPYLLENEVENKTQFGFDGVVHIQIQTLKSSIDQFAVHVKYLTINQLNFFKNDRPSDDIVKKYTQSNITDQVKIHLINPLIVGFNYTLTIVYNGTIRNGCHGFYRYSTINQNNETSWTAVTQFSPSYARMTFPCFDEPKFKATFIIKINRNNQYKSYSNSRLNYSVSVEGQNRSIDVFKETPLMSTYIVAFLVCDFEERSVDNNFRILARKEDFEYTEFAFNYSLKVLNILEEFTGIPYNSMVNVEKLDFAVISKLCVTAMENWGLITFQQDSFLCENCSEVEKIDIIRLIGHELTHMWFGNLVSVDWWSYTWLKEAFATYLTYFAIHKAYNQDNLDWNMEEQIVSGRLEKLFFYDYEKNLHAMTNRSVQTVSESWDMFSLVTYSKGAIILRMFDHILGRKQFQTALQNYLKKHSYRTATPDDLLVEFNDQWMNSDIDIHTMFLDWTEQTGYPIVTINSQIDGKSFTISQKQFFNNESAVKLFARQWTIPLTFLNNIENDCENTKPRFFLEKNQTTKISFNTEIDWLIANVNMTGYYRVNYDEKNWKNIGAALQNDGFSGIPPINRYQLVMDLTQYTEINLISYELALEILEYLKIETKILIIELLPGAFATIENKLFDLDFKLFKLYKKIIYEKIYDQVENSDSIEHNIKQKIVEEACISGIQKCVKTILKNFDSKKHNFTEFEVCLAVQEHPEFFFEKFFEQWQNSFEENYKNLTGLVCTTDENQLKILLNFVLKQTNETKKNEFFRYVLTFQCHLKGLILDFVVQNYENISKTINEKLDFIWEDLLFILAGHIKTEQQFDIIKNFVNRNNVKYKLIKKYTEQVTERAEKAFNWRKRHAKNISNYLQKYLQFLPIEKEPKGQNFTISSSYVFFQQTVLNIQY